MASTGPRPPGSAYFEKKGEVHELKQLLRSAAADRDQSKKREAIKKVIAYMTLGIDVSPLFSEMVMASATQDLVQKKMVYLYLVNYAESNAELAILAVNTLLKDSRDDDPMIRGLALRSLCSLSLVNMLEYLQPAVQRGLEDVNGYVRKTAVIGVIKLFHTSRASVLESQIAETLKRLVYDNDAHVVANTIVAIEEVLGDEGGLQPTREMVTGLLNRLNQFSEWGQCAVLKILAKYQVADESEMFDVMNILDSLLKQSSSAVVLGVTKIFLDLTSNRADLQMEVLRRLKGPLLTLMAAATPELAYTVLVHVQSICTHGGGNVEVFRPEYKQFFCRYNEPSYIKQVKIDILTMLADPTSSEAIVAELSEYVTDVDADISRRAIRAIGQIAVRVPSYAEMIVSSLGRLLELDIDYVSTEAAVVMKDLVRKYPQQFQLGAVERCIRIVTEPEGKCAVLWILGEYGLVIEDAPYLLEPMIDNFMEEESGAVRLEMLTAAVKLFFSRAPETQHMLGRLLKKAIQETTHPDVRDRALLYYRLLETSPEEARRVIFSMKEVVEEFQEEVDLDARDRLYEEFNTLSTVFKQPAPKFVPKAQLGMMAVRMPPPPLREDEILAQRQNGGEANAAPAPVPAYEESLLSGGSQPAPTPAPTYMAAEADLLGEGLGAPVAPVPPAPAPPAQSTGGYDGDLLGMGDLLGGDMDALPSQPSPPAQAQFALAFDAVMDGGDFQARWGNLQAVPAQHRQMRQLPVALTTSAVDEALSSRGIKVIASGNIPPGNSLKFFFYARQASGPPSVGAPGSQVWFLSELIMVPGGTAQCSLKVENGAPACVECFLGLLWASLESFVL